MTNLTLDDVLATFEARKAAIEARPVPRLHYVLSWGNGLFVGNTTRDPHIAGFEHAIFFGDREAARAFLRSTNIRNGADVRPAPVLAFNAKQGALIELDRAITDISSHKGA